MQILLLLQDADVYRLRYFGLLGLCNRPSRPWASGVSLSLSHCNPGLDAGVKPR